MVYGGIDMATPVIMPRRGQTVESCIIAKWHKQKGDNVSEEAKAFAEECRSGAINPDKLKGGTFTVTNLGTIGIEHFTPVLNPLQVGILGVNTIVTRIRETGRCQE